MSETDAAFVNSIDNRPRQDFRFIPQADIDRLLSLARRGAEAAALTARVEELERVLRKARTAVSALRELEKASKAHGEALKMDCDLAEIDAALSQPALNTERTADE
jgi:3-methyladenine DNA glycosylase/8-oxoguanine DNA glycosylase